MLKLFGNRSDLSFGQHCHRPLKQPQPKANWLKIGLMLKLAAEHLCRHSCASERPLTTLIVISGVFPAAQTPSDSKWNFCQKKFFKFHQYTFCVRQTFCTVLLLYKGMFVWVDCQSVSKSGNPWISVSSEPILSWAGEYQGEILTTFECRWRLSFNLN